MKKFGVLIYVTIVIVLVDLEEISEKIDDAFCKLQCYDEIIPSCFGECDCNKDLIPNQGDINMTQYGRSELLKLKCKAEDMLHVEWNNTFNPFEEATNRTVYFLHIMSNFHNFFTDVTFCNFYTLRTTLSNTVYNITLWGVDNGNNVFVSKPLSVLTANSSSAPLPVPNITLDLIPDEEKYQGVVKWIPSADLSCYYEIVLYCTNSGNNHNTIPAPDVFDIIEPSELYNLHIDELKFGYNYELTIRAKGLEFENESTNTTIYKYIPTCLETFKNITICEPEQPQNLTIKESMIGNFNEYLSEDSILYDVSLNWSQPTLNPDYYIAQLNIMNTSLEVKNISSLNISGEATFAKFEHVELTTYYQIHLEAVSKGGRSRRAVIESLVVHPLRQPMPKKNMENMVGLKYLLVIIGVAAGLLILIYATLSFRQQRLNQKDSQEEKRNKDETDNRKQQNNRQNTTNQIMKITDKWEISFERLIFGTELGEGAFGIVQKALLGQNPVACKKLRENCTADEIRGMLQEIEIMKNVGSHPNIVSMIGCVTENVPNGPMLIVEYCSNGDLLRYLRTIYNNMANQLNKLLEGHNEDGYNDFTNKLYGLDIYHNENELSLTQMDVISYGRQIAMGMEYLSNQKVLHRDLAARNILMCDDKRVKVSDFGLSRDVYMDSVYCITTNRKLPIRWMALESLTHQIYTSQSDVWSFGVLLWEIVSLGALPYPGVQNHELLCMLREGKRMAKPQLCSDDIYSIMMNCWKEPPQERPTFSSLTATFEGLLSNETDYLELSTDI